jgi:hypothetical protein
MTGPLAIAMTGPLLVVKGAASLVTPKEDEPLLTKVLRFVGVGTVVVVAVIVGVYLTTHSQGGSPNATVTQQANPQPNLGGAITAARTPAAKSTAKSKSKSKSGTKTTKSGTADYVLSTPATAGGYSMGQDPDFLATATATAQTILSTVGAAGGGTATGSAVSAPYMLPTGSQVVTFVGYHGTFNPSKVITSMGSFGTTDGTYADAKTGDSIACANTSSSPSGAVCVWATTTTIGVTEFFDVSGPEALTTSQDKGAADTIKLRASVETKKS